jgi:hypothetical protein
MMAGYIMPSIMLVWDRSEAILKNIEINGNDTFRCLPSRVIDKNSTNDGLMETAFLLIYGVEKSYFIVITCNIRP